MSAAGWHPDPAGVAGRLRWWDGQTWTDHIHDQAVTPGSPLDAPVLVVAPPRAAAPGTRVFDLGDGAGVPLGRLVETARGANDSAFGAALSRSRGWQNATTRELRGANGFPELVLAWGPSAPGVITAALPDRREVGRLLLGDAGWTMTTPDGRSWGTATSAGSAAADGQTLSRVAIDGSGGWRTTIEPGPGQEPLRSLVAAASVAADVL